MCTPHENAEPGAERRGPELASPARAANVLRSVSAPATVSIMVLAGAGDSRGTVPVGYQSDGA